MKHDNVHDKSGRDVATVRLPLTESRLAFFLPLALGIVLRCILGWDLNVPPVSDFTANLRNAVDLSRGELDSTLSQGPRSLVLGIGLWLLGGGSGYREVFLANTLLLYPLGAAAIWLLARQALGDRRLWLPQLLYAVWPPFVYSVPLAATENVLPFAMCLPLWGLARALDRRTLASALLGGVTLGTSLLLKPVLLSLSLLFFLAFFLRRLEEPPYVAVRFAGLGRCLLLAGGYVLAASLVLTPWQIYSYAKLGFFEPVSPFGNHMLSCVNTPYGKRAYETGSDYAENLMPELRAATSPKEENAAKKAYAKEFLAHWPLFFVGQIPENLPFLLLPINEMALWVHGDLPGGLAGYPPGLRLLHQGCIGLGLLLGAGGFLCFATRRGQTAKSLIRLTLVVGFVSTLVLLLGNLRHRMAYEPYLFILGASWVECFTDGARAGLMAPLTGVTFLVRRLWGSLCWLGRWSRRRLALGGALALLGGLAWAVPSQTIHVTAESRIGGTVAPVASRIMGTPHPVIGNPLPGDGPWSAEFAVSVPAAGVYRLGAVYAAAGRYPVDVLVNGETQLTGVFGESFGGAANAFARKRDIGRVRLRQGENILALRPAGPWQLPVPQPLALVRLEAREPDGLALGEDDWQWLPFGPARRFVLQSGRVELALAAGTGIVVRVQTDSYGQADLRLSITLYPAPGANAQPRTHVTGLSALHQAMFIKPDFDVAAVAVEFSGSGSGWFLANRVVRIEPGVLRDVLDRPGRLYSGPYIERLELRLDR